jgi:hypothetical protein
LPPEEREQTKSLDISQSKKELLKEGEKWKKISTIF